MTSSKAENEVRIENNRLLRERQVNREKSRSQKFYSATKPSRGLPPRMKRLEALKELKKIKSGMSTEESILYCQEIIERIEEELKQEEKKGHTNE